jgi:alpha-galactosidase
MGREPSEVEVRNLHRFVEKATVLLAPADRFRSAAALLQRRGVRVSERGTGRSQFFRIDAGAAATGVSDEDVKPLPTIVIAPTPTPIPLRGGPQVSLSALEPARVEFGFAAPQIDREWDNPPITLGGVRYDHGIGMHAWCRMTYAVPPNAVEFQAIVGIADKMRECPRAAVIFEVRDDKDAVLFHSGLVDGTTPPMPIHADVRGKGSVTLVVTDAGNGIDCDHADWALPSFLLSR